MPDLLKTYANAHASLQSIPRTNKKVPCMDQHEECRVKSLKKNKKKGPIKWIEKEIIQIKQS